MQCTICKLFYSGRKYEDVFFVQVRRIRRVPVLSSSDKKQSADPVIWEVSKGGRCEIPRTASEISCA